MNSERTSFSDVEAVLFDIDGTLLNTFEFIYQSFEHALQLHGGPTLTRPEIAKHMGGPLEECYRGIMPHGDAAAMSEAHRAYQADNIHLAELFPATIDVLEHLTKSGRKLGAITSRSLRSSVRSMDATGISKYFKIILSAEDVTRHKPDPEPVFRALGALEVSTDKAVMIGDTYADVEAGKNAGVRTIGVLYGFGGESLLSTHPDAAIRDLRELIELIP